MSDFTEISEVDFKDKLPENKSFTFDNINSVSEYVKETNQNLGNYIKDRADEMRQNDKFIKDNKEYINNKQSGVLENIKDNVIETKDNLLNNKDSLYQDKESSKYTQDKLINNADLTS